MDMEVVDRGEDGSVTTNSSWILGWEGCNDVYRPIVTPLTAAY